MTTYALVTLCGYSDTTTARRPQPCTHLWKRQRPPCLATEGALRGHERDPVTCDREPEPAATMLRDVDHLRGVPGGEHLGEPGPAAVGDPVRPAVVAQLVDAAEHDPPAGGELRQ